MVVRPAINFLLLKKRREQIEVAMGSKKTNLADATNRRRKDEQTGLLKRTAPNPGRHDPAGQDFPFSPDDQAKQRLETLLRFDQLKKIHGGSKAAQMVGASVPTLWRWSRSFSAHGVAGLRPKLSNCGKRSKFKAIRLTTAAVRALELLIVEPGSTRTAWLKFAKTQLCPPLIARTVQRTGKVPAALADLGRVSQVQARCFVSADGRRLYVKLPGKAVIMSKLALPPGFKLLEVKQ